MKTGAKNSWLLCALMAGLSMMPVARLAAQPVTQIAAGNAHTLFVKSDGSLWATGWNNEGQLGIGATPGMTNIPQEVVSNGVRAVVAGDGHSLFLAGSSLWVMGYNLYGELGDGTFSNQYFPEKTITLIPSVSSFSGIAAGSEHSLLGISSIVAASTGLETMGNNASGQLGDGTFNNTNRPEQVVSSIAISAVSGGGNFSLFIESGGSLWGMGDNSKGQLGENYPNGTNKPEQILSSGVTAVVAGGAHSLFIKSDGSLWVWATISMVSWAITRPRTGTLRN